MVPERGGMGASEEGCAIEGTVGPSRDDGGGTSTRLTVSDARIRSFDVRCVVALVAVWSCACACIFSVVWCADEFVVGLVVARAKNAEKKDRARAIGDVFHGMAAAKTDAPVERINDRDEPLTAGVMGGGAVDAATARCEAVLRCLILVPNFESA